MLILRPGKQTADNDIRGMQRHNVLLYEGTELRHGSLGSSECDYFMKKEESVGAWMNMLSILYQGAICMSA